MGLKKISEVGEVVFLVIQTLIGDIFNGVYDSGWRAGVTV